MSLDHGMLNLPLAKRGDIDAQLDAYKAARKSSAAAERRAAAATGRELKARAKSALAAICAAAGLLEQKAEHFKVSRTTLLSNLQSWAKWEPARLLDLHAKWLPVVSAAE